MIYKTDLHVHSTDISQCSNAQVEDIVRIYAAYGYDTVVLCNHFNRYTADKLQLSYEEFVHAFAGAYRKLKKAAEGKFHVLFGAEIRFDENINDYLLFGADEEKLLAIPTMWEMNVKTFAPVYREMGMLLYQAHPFRVGMTVVDPALLTGIEVHNGHPGHNSSNDIAAQWARKYALPGTSGSDFHNITHVPSGGILTEEPITTKEELCRVLQEKKYSLITRL